MRMYRHRSRTRTSRDPVKRAVTSWQRNIFEHTGELDTVVNAHTRGQLAAIDPPAEEFWHSEDSCTLMGGVLAVSVAIRGGPTNAVYQFQAQAHRVPAEILQAESSGGLSAQSVSALLLAKDSDEHSVRHSSFTPFAVASEFHYGSTFHGTAVTRFRAKRKLARGDGLAVTLVAVGSSSFSDTIFTVAGRLDWVCRS